MKEDLISGAKGKTSISLTSGKPGEQMDCGAEEDVLFVRRLSPQAHIPSKGSCRSNNPSVNYKVLESKRLFNISCAHTNPTRIYSTIFTFNSGIQTTEWEKTV